MNPFKAKGTSVDALLFTVVRVVTLLLNLIGIRFISQEFSLEAYGLYSQALLIVSTVTSFTILGMSDGVNYFFNNAESQASEERRKAHLSTIFLLQVIVGTLAGVLILLFGPNIADYFHNPALVTVLIWVAFQPLMANLLPMLQILYISTKHTKVIVVRNLIISILRLLIFVYAVFVTKSIATILCLIFVCDILQVAYFLIDLHRRGITVFSRNIDVKLVSPILKYCIPMSFFVLINALMRDVDKWVVGYFTDSETLALYTNACRVLPFDILITSFATVLVPIITQNISTNKEVCQRIYGNYLNLGLFTTVILVGLAIVFSSDLLVTLYSEKYLPALNIFRVFLVLDMFRFANVSLLFSAAGKIKTLIWNVSFTFIFNLVACIGLYYWIGLIGTAIATVLSTAISYWLYMYNSKTLLNRSVFRLLDYKRLLIIIGEIIMVGFGILLLNNHFLGELNCTIRLLMIYPISVALIMFLNNKPILQNIKELNRA